MLLSRTVFCLLTMLSLANKIHGVKIVMMHMMGGSHFFTTRVLAQELSRRGHKVTMCSPESNAVSKAKISLLPIQIIPLPFNNTKFDLFTKEVTSSKYKGFGGQLRHFLELEKLIEEECSSLLSNSEAVQAILDADLVIAEIGVYCIGLVMRKFEKKWIGLVPFSVPEFVSYIHGVTLNPTVLPTFSSSFTDQMTFFQRLQNYLMHSMVPILCHLLHRFEGLKQQYGLPNDLTLKALNDAEIIISNCDFAVSYPHPSMPNYFCVGSFTSGQSKELASPFQEYVEKATNGIILVSFGTTFEHLTRKQIAIMASVFGRLKQDIIWKIKDTKGVALSNNVKTVAWLPQNDLLGNARVVLFISHVGQSSLMEACYHGVTVLAVPRASDQVPNALIASHRLKIGEMLDIEFASEEEWFSKIQLILNRESYRVNAQRISRLIQSRKQRPLELAGDLVQYVIDNNYDMSHLKSFGNHLPWYTFHSIDIKAFLLSIFLFTLFVLYKCTIILIRFSFGGKRKKD